MNIWGRRREKPIVRQDDRNKCKEKNKEKKKEWKELGTVLENSRTILNAQTFGLGIPEEVKKKGYEKIFQKITVKNVPNMGKEITTQVQEAQRVPNRINQRQTPQNTY